jgi:hypothetical protein
LFRFEGNRPLLGRDPTGYVDNPCANSIVQLVPILGTICNEITNPQGSKVEDYKVDLSGCDDEASLYGAEQTCRAKIAAQGGRFTLSYNALFVAHDFVDGIAGALAAQTGIPQASAVLLIDGAIDSWISLGKSASIALASQKALEQCHCKGCHK